MKTNTIKKRDCTIIHFGDLYPSSSPLFVGIILGYLLLFGILLQSCSKNPKCWGADKEKGIIESVIQINCYPIIYQSTYIINDEESFNEIFNNDSTGTNTCNLPEIDFSSKTLLGQYGSGGCEVKVIREVDKKENEKRYYYTVTIKECGSCKKLYESFNWVIVPKLPDGWEVIFEMENK